MTLPFLSHLEIKLTPKFIKIICDRLNNEKVSELGSLTINQYIAGIRSFDNEENGIYFICFPDKTYYVGASASGTLLERLSKHLDGRSVGRSNTLLKKLNNSNKKSYYAENQDFFTKASILFLPITADSIKTNGKLPDKGKKIINYLEEDLIYLFHNSGLKLLNTRIPKKLSNLFQYED
jgi:hypothetical protein